MGEAFQFLWTTGKDFLSFELDFGDVSFTLWDFCIGGAVLSIILYFVSGFFSRGD